MAEKEYIVSLHKGADKNLILSDLNRDTSSDSAIDSSIVPDRTVSISDQRSSSKRMFHVNLTEDEAQALLNHPDVGGVNEPLEWDDDWLDYEQEANWTRDNSSTVRTNWGLRRHIVETNPWGTGSQNADLSGSYPYHLDGTGIDYIHQESKFRFDHEQWQDKDGNSRLQEFQWNTLPNMSSIPTIDYSNTAGSSYHATHCAGIAVGKDYGWAKNANIFCLPMDIVDSSLWFDAIKEFHKAKTPDPVTGVVRPTVVSASWGYKAYFTSMTAIQFRGANVGTVKSTNYGMIGDGINRFNANLYNLNAEVEEMQDEGVHYMKSAGNQGQKLCYPGDIDYDNYIIRSISTGGIASGNPIYYNRGAGNIGPDTIVVGNLDSALYSNSESCATSSDKGPRVDVYTAGTDIVSATNTTSSAVANYSGTSMSTPQVAGMSCLVLQLNPGWSPAQLRKWWQDNALKGALYQGSTDENNASTFFANNRNLMSPDATSNRIAQFPFAANFGVNFTSPYDTEYRNFPVIDVTGDGVDFFKREVTTNGVRIMGAGGVGGQVAVPDAWLEKVARMFELFTDPNGAGINETYQRQFIKTLRGDAGTYHAGFPTIQRVARGAGADYSTNFLTDAGILFWNLTNLFDTHVQNDMVWYLNSTGDGYGDGDIDAQEVIEHVFHTLHMHGLPAEDIKLYPYISSDWATGDLYAAMEEAYDAGKWDPSGYNNPSNDWKTNGDAFEVAAKEYLFLLNFAMFEYTELWDGGSLSPEWTDDMRTQAGILANNPLGYAFHNTYIAPVISKPSLATIRSIFQDGNTPAQDDPSQAGESGYVVD